MQENEKSVVIQCVEDGPYYGRYLQNFHKHEAGNGMTSYSYFWTDNKEDARVYEPLEEWPVIPDVDVCYRKVEYKERAVGLVATIRLPLVVRESAITQQHAERLVEDRMVFENPLTADRELRDLWSYLEEEHGAYVDQLEIADYD